MPGALPAVLSLKTILHDEGYHPHSIDDNTEAQKTQDSVLRL